MGNFIVRAGVVGLAGYLAYRYLPLPAVGKTAVVAVAAVAATAIVAQGVPMLGSLLDGQIPLPAPASS